MRIHREQLHPAPDSRKPRLPEEDRQPRQADLCRQSGEPGGGRRGQPVRLRPGRHRRRGPGRRAPVRARDRCGRQFRGREPRGPLDRFAGALRPDERRRDAEAPERRQAPLDEPLARRPGRLPVPARVDGRGLRDAWARGSGVHGGDPLRAQFPVRRLQGRERPPGPGLPPHLRAPDADDQLLEQLRALPFPGEADPARDPERARGQAPAGLRRRQAGARLALRRGPLPGDLARPQARQARRDLQRGRPERADEPAMS